MINFTKGFYKPAFGGKVRMVWGQIRIILKSALCAFSFCAFFSNFTFSQQGADVPAAPASVELPCTDSSRHTSDPNDDRGGRIEYGRRPCGKVKQFVQDRLKEKVGNTLAYYYSGSIVDYTDDGVGMCKLNTQPVGVVCELGTPNFADREANTNSPSRMGATSEGGAPAQRCGQKANADPGTDAACFSSPGPSATICGESRAAFGRQEIGDLQQFVSQNINSTNDNLKREAISKAALLADSSALSGKLVSDWRSYLNSGNEYCIYNKDGVDLSTCGKELAWIRGMRVSAYLYYYEQVMTEIDQGNLNLVDYGGSKPCGEFARSLGRMLNGDPSVRNAIGIRAAENLIRSKYEDVKDKIGTSTENMCPGSNLDDQAGTASALASSFDTSQLGRGTKEVNRISLAVCSLNMARRQLEQVFSKLAYCEVSFRAKKRLEEVVLSDDMMQKFRTQVGEVCGRYAESTFSLNIFSNFCLTGCAMENFYKCYRGDNIPSLGSHGVEKFFYDYSRQSNGSNTVFPYRPDHPLEIKKMLVPAASSRIRIPATLTPGQPIPDSAIPQCPGSDGSLLGAGVGGFLLPFKRRRRKKPKSAVTNSILFITVLFAMISAACTTSGQRTVQGIPCPTGIPHNDPNRRTISCNVGDSACVQRQLADCRELQLFPIIQTLAAHELDANSKIQTIISINTDSGAALAQADPHARKSSGNQSLSAATAANIKKDPLSGAQNSRSGQGFGTRSAATASLPSSTSSSSGNLNISGDLSDGQSAGGVNNAFSGNSSDDTNAIDASSSGGASGQNERALASTHSGEGGFEDSSGSRSGSVSGSRGSSEPNVVLPGDGKTGDADDYFSKNSPKLSLFEIVSRRYAAWGAELEEFNRVKK